MKLILKFEQDENGKIHKAHLSFDSETMESLRELFSPSTFREKHDDLRLFSESSGRGNHEGPPLSDENYFEGCEVIDNLELNYLGDTKVSEEETGKRAK